MSRLSTVKKIFLLPLFFLIAYPVIYFDTLMKYMNLYSSKLPQNNTINSDWSKLINSEDDLYEVIKYVKDETNKDSLFLVFRQSEFVYYAGRRYIDDSDPILIGLYRMLDKYKAYNCLQELGIDYIYLPKYMTPTFYNTQICHITADPELCELIKSIGGYRLFRFHKVKRKVYMSPVKITNADFSLRRPDGKSPAGWTLYTNEKKDKAENWSMAKDQDGESVLTVNNWDKGNTYLYSGDGPIDFLPHRCFSFGRRIEPDTMYHFNARLKGDGIFKVFLAEFNAEGKYSWVPLWDAVLSEDYKNIENSFVTSEDAHEYRIIFILEGKGELNIKNVSMERIDFPGEDRPALDHALGNKDGPDDSGGLLQDYNLYKENFEKVAADRPENLGWSTYSNGDPITWPWGLTEDGFQSKAAIYLKQGEQEDPGWFSNWLRRTGIKEKNYQDLWLYTGSGGIADPPSSNFDRSGTIETLQAPWMSEFRIGFLLKEYDEEPGIIYVDDPEFSLSRHLPDNSGKGIFKKRRISLDPELHEWSVSSERDYRKRSTGLTETSHPGMYGPDMRKPSPGWISLPLEWLGLETDDRSAWLYTGPGQLSEPPGESGDMGWHIGDLGEPMCRFTARVKGRGSCGLYFWWYDQYGKAKNQYLGDYFLPRQYEMLDRKFYLPHGPVEGRLSASVKGKGSADLYIWWYNPNGEASYFPLGRYDLSEKDKKIEAEFILPPEAQEFRVALQMGNDQDKSAISLNDLNVEFSESHMDAKSEPGKVWSPVMVSDLESVAPEKPESLGWSTYSEGLPVTWEWGLTEESHAGRYGLYLKQSGNKDTWLYTGHGDITHAPSQYLDNDWKIRNKGPSPYRLTASVKGKGYVLVYVWWYDQDGQLSNQELGRYYLPEEYKLLTREFELPQAAFEYRIGFLFKESHENEGKDSEPSILYVDNFKIEH